MNDSIFAPAAVAGLLTGIAFALIGSAVEGFVARELLMLLAIAAGVLAGQAWTIRHHEMAASGTFGARYFTGMLSGAITGGVYSAIVWLYLAWLDPAYLERMHAEYMQRAVRSAASAEHGDQVLASAERMRDFILDPLSQAMMQFGTALMIALITGLMAASWIRSARRA